jgi:radial spoke head protein 9
LFWGRITGVKADYYVAMGVCYKDRYEFPEKKFYWCSQANGMTFQAFPELNIQHVLHYDALSSQIF